MTLLGTHHASIVFANGGARFFKPCRAAPSPPPPPCFCWPCKLASRSHHASIVFANGGGCRWPSGRGRQCPVAGGRRRPEAMAAGRRPGTQKMVKLKCASPSPLDGLCPRRGVLWLGFGLVPPWCGWVFRVKGLGFGVYLGFKAYDLRVRVQGLGFWGLGLRLRA